MTHPALEMLLVIAVRKLSYVCAAMSDSCLSQSLEVVSAVMSFRISLPVLTIFMSSLIAEFLGIPLSAPICNGCILRFQPIDCDDMRVPSSGVKLGAVSFSDPIRGKEVHTLIAENCVNFLIAAAKARFEVPVTRSHEMRELQRVFDYEKTLHVLRDEQIWLQLSLRW